MKIIKRKNLITLFLLSLLILTSCKGGADKEIISEENHLSSESKKREKKSGDDLVVDRQAWKEFLDNKHEDLAKKSEAGLHFPKILLESEDAKKANEEISSLIEQFKALYKEHGKDMENDQIGMFASFSSFQDDKVLSIHLKTSNIWDGSPEKHRIFNFSLPEGKFITDEKLMHEKDLDKDQILSRMEDSIVEEYKKLSKEYEQGEDQISFIDRLTNPMGLSLNYLWDNFPGEKNEIYLDENGQACFIYKEYINAGSGSNIKNLKLEEEKNKDGDYSDIYFKMASIMGRDFDYKDKKAFVIYLGSARDESSLKKVLSNLNIWQEEFYKAEDLNVLPMLEETDDGPYKLKGEEYYLLIPKWRNASIALKQLVKGRNKDVVEKDNEYLDRLYLTGPLLICQKEYKGQAYAKIKLRYRDEKLEFSLTKDENNRIINLPEGIIDASEIIYEKDQKQVGQFSKSIFEEIISVMDKK